MPATAMLILPEWKRDNFDLGSRCLAIQQECFELRAHIVETAFHVAEGDLLSNSFAARGARDPAGFFASGGGGAESHARLERHVAQRNQATQSFIGLTGHLDPRNHFLANATALPVTYPAMSQVRFHRD